MVNPVGGSGTVEGRDGWCTPRWLAEVIGPVDLDPCGNERSHIDATVVRRWDRYEDGLEFKADDWWRVFINPPYARGQVVRWVRHYAHTNFLFLLRWAPDTSWFAELWPKCWGAWFPTQRINFEPPPGVASSSNPFPHALYLAKEPTGDFLDRLLAAGYLVKNERQRRCNSSDVTTGPSPPGGAGGGGATATATRQAREAQGTHGYFNPEGHPAARRAAGGQGSGS